MSQKLQAQVYACQYCDRTLHNAFNLKEREQRCKEKGKTMKQKTFLCPHCQRICDNTHNLEQSCSCHMDTRVCLNIPNIFWKAKHLQIAQVVAKANGTEKVYARKDGLIPGTPTTCWS